MIQRIARCWHCNSETPLITPDGWICTSCGQHGSPFEEPAHSIEEGCIKNRPYITTQTGSLEMSTEQLLKDILGAQKQQTVAINQLLAQLDKEAQTRQTQAQNQANAFAAWRDNHPEIVDRCKDTRSRLDDVFAYFLNEMLDIVDDLSEPNMFTTREFIDRYSQSFIQLNATLQIINSLIQ